MEAYTLRPEAIMAFTLGRSSLGFTAWKGQASTHRPQATHISGMTAACPLSTRIAFTGHSRMHRKHPWHSEPKDTTFEQTTGSLMTGLPFPEFPVQDLLYSLRRNSRVNMIIHLHHGPLRTQPLAAAPLEENSCLQIMLLQEGPDHFKGTGISPAKQELPMQG